MLSQILDLLFKVMDIDRAAILSVNEKSQALECKATKLILLVGASIHASVCVLLKVNEDKIAKNFRKPGH